MGKEQLQQALYSLQDQFETLDWTLYDTSYKGQKEKEYRWPGDEKEDILVVVHKSNGVREEFHRHDFFFFNYTYKGSYESLSQTYKNKIEIHEGELYAGQPQAGHALFAHDNQETIVIGVLIKKQVFFQFFLPLLSNDSKLFHFFLDPQTKSYTDEFIHFKPQGSCELISLLEMMVVEYASGRVDTQNILRPLAISYLAYITREYTATAKLKEPVRASDKVIVYLNTHFGSASLADASRFYGYHPNYLSALVKKETGKTFSELHLEIRMERAMILLQNTTLSVNDISVFLGYSNTSNFYKAFKDFYHTSPRDLVSQ